MRLLTEYLSAKAKVKYSGFNIESMPKELDIRKIAKFFADNEFEEIPDALSTNEFYSKVKSLDKPWYTYYVPNSGSECLNFGNCGEISFENPEFLIRKIGLIYHFEEYANNHHGLLQSFSKYLDPLDNYKDFREDVIKFFNKE